MPELLSRHGEGLSISSAELRGLLEESVAKISPRPRKVLLVPPDATRLISRAGEITAILYEIMSPYAKIDIMPALGTHTPMVEGQLRHMFGEKIPLSCFHPHNWREDVVRKGVVEAGRLSEWSGGKVSYDVGVEVNKILFAGYDLILSIGQVLPHEVVGMANYTKNIMVGVGGADSINKSHFLGAACGMESILGRCENPVRWLFNAGVGEFLGDLPIYYALTIVSRDAAAGSMATRGYFFGTGDGLFRSACELSAKVNITRVDKPIRKAVVTLDPHEFKSTWLGNKAVYRTRMAMADGGELIILAPGLKEFGEDGEIDRLIRKYGYHGTPATLDAVAKNAELRENLSAAAHLIHGSSEGRFKVTYAPGFLSESEIRSVGFNYADLGSVTAKYKPESMVEGWNADPDGGELFHVSAPASGLWVLSERFC